MNGDNGTSRQPPANRKTHATRPPVMHALTFDVEEWFHAANLAVPARQWPDLPTRLGAVIPELLTLLEQHHTKATFFVLGWIARTSPALVRQIADAGHEIASHSYWHLPVDAQTRRQFRADTRLSKQVLEDATGQAVKGFRAPSYSIPRLDHWAFGELLDAGFVYDSSVYPVRAPHGRYGIAAAPTYPHRMRQGIWEFPLPVLHVAGKRLPAATGAYLRLAPYAVTDWAIRQYQRRSRPAVVNIHPWELDPDQPVWKARRWNRFLHYSNLATTRTKLVRLLQRFQFAPLRSLLRHLGGDQGAWRGVEEQRSKPERLVTRIPANRSSTRIDLPNP